MGYDIYCRIVTILVICFIFGLIMSWVTESDGSESFDCYTDLECETMYGVDP